ncbi:TSSK2-like protein [Mya arenaria]|uniref:TSSK2-like protein n=1 Tax=Mya arenaria TaxID=6604 RepID=A0ABY7FGL9_MYAAR|nr:testis-specific serine/threonine-protein kinase 2-like [Mya arenaria]XP_052777845.1 testis-specific serine/threonine-protein kinase 2-like [Mya arenaria]WAR20101.1 TSSK2-like protein [Mya arenaria]WAR23676.1 TSSK2-like protein [Mya arenaria]
MLPSKRPKIESSEESSSWELALKNDLETMKGEVEPIDVKKSSTTKMETVTYRPTYRAVLAKKGLLVKQTLGSGSYSKVKFAYCLDNYDYQKAAVKIIDRNKAPRDFQTRFLPRELSIWPRMIHPNIARMYEMFEDNIRVYMILEFAENGDVLRYIQKSGAIKDHLARIWIRQVGDAVKYLHDQDITHRDLKLENLLLDCVFNIKICDFGFVKSHSMKELSKTYCGSKSYASPEILRGEPYDPKKADMWAMGVILYIFITGKMPFDESKGNTGVLEEQRKLNFPWQKFRYVTPEVKAIILTLFKSSYTERPGIDDVMDLTWISADLIPGDGTERQGNRKSHHSSIQNQDKPDIQREFAIALQSRTKSK